MLYLASYCNGVNLAYCLAYNIYVSRIQYQWLQGISSHVHMPKLLYKLENWLATAMVMYRLYLAQSLQPNHMAASMGRPCLLEDAKQGTSYLPGVKEWHLQR